jgi:hypothetical protein
MSFNLSNILKSLAQVVAVAQVGEALTGKSNQTIDTIATSIGTINAAGPSLQAGKPLFLSSFMDSENGVAHTVEMWAVHKDSPLSAELHSKA